MARSAVAVGAGVAGAARAAAATALAALLVVAAPRALWAQDEEVGLALGAAAPAVRIEDLDGRPVDLASVIGQKPVLLEFWATWCPLCARLEPRLRAAQRRYGSRVEFLVIAVAVNQTPESVRRHLERHPVPGRVLWDAGGAATRAFQAPTTSYVVVLDRRGRVAYTGVGDEQDLEAAVARVVER